MKKSFVLFLTILMFGLAIVFWGQNSILAESDNVKITEKILYGDKSVVEGTILNLRNHYEDQLFWDTTYVIGEEPQTKTEYTFYQTKYSVYRNQWDGGIHFNYDVHHMDWGNDAIYAPEGIALAIQELKDSVGPSETGNKTVFLKDYEDYYSFSVSVQTPFDSSDEKRFHYELSENELREQLMQAEEKNARDSEDTLKQLRKELKWMETFREFFKIPVLENETYIIAVEKDANENVIGWAISSASGGAATGDIEFPEFTFSDDYDNFEFCMSSAVGDGDVYLTFNTRSSNQKVVDTSLIPGGYGIYHFPYDLEKEEIYPEQLQLVYALDPELDVIDLTKDARGENLLLFTIEDADLYMSVIDIETMKLVDKFSLSETRENMAYGLEYCVTEEDYVIAVTYGDVIVFSIDEEGNYTKNFETSREPLNAFFAEDYEHYCEVLEYNTAFDWNGEKLLFANNMYNVNGYMGTGFYVGVMDENGLQYFATYETSLQSPISKDESGYEMYNYPHVRPVEDEPISVNWE